MPTFSGTMLRQTAERILEAAGTPRESAQVVAESLVAANLVGHDSHGVIRLTDYVKAVRAKQVSADAKPTVKARHQATAQVDGNWGWGQLAARLATQTVIELAQEYGIGAVTIEHCNHIGRLGEYVEKISQAKMAGLALCNAGAAVAPFGGRQRLIGTNPLAFAAPRDNEQEPLLMDFATSGVAEGKLRVARDKGEKVGSGLIVDKEGQPSQDPDAFYDGGALLPFGAHKGYGLSVMIELLGGILSGIGTPSNPDYRGGNGTLIMAVNISSFIPVDQFTEQTERLLSDIKASQPAEGFKSVLTPGDPEMQSRSQRQENGIPVPEQTWRDIQALAKELNVTIAA